MEAACVCGNTLGEVDDGMLVWGLELVNTRRFWHVQYVNNAMAVASVDFISAGLRNGVAAEFGRYMGLWVFGDAFSVFKILFPG